MPFSSASGGPPWVLCGALWSHGSIRGALFGASLLCGLCFRSRNTPWPQDIARARCDGAAPRLRRPAGRCAAPRRPAPAPSRRRRCRCRCRPSSGRRRGGGSPQGARASLGGGSGSPGALSFQGFPNIDPGPGPTPSRPQADASSARDRPKSTTSGTDARRIPSARSSAQTTARPTLCPRSARAHARPSLCSAAEGVGPNGAMFPWGMRHRTQSQALPVCRPLVGSQSTTGRPPCPREGQRAKSYHARLRPRSLSGPPPLPPAMFGPSCAPRVMQGNQEGGSTDGTGRGPSAPRPESVSPVARMRGWARGGQRGHTCGGGLATEMAGGGCRGHPDKAHATAAGSAATATIRRGAPALAMD